MAKLVTNASSATWWPKLELIQVTPPGGQTFFFANSCFAVKNYKGVLMNLGFLMILVNLVSLVNLGGISVHKYIVCMV